ncbi:MAG TPA: KTSC domain-containing protein [Acidobacteriaceae bacterium]|nr:KTSC domain-containing protein [Acidobacteriaceae bacterium]
MPSRVIHGMVYWPERRYLDIVFRGTRGTYRYFDVSAEEWRRFKRAPSKGTYLNASFKDRHPHYERVKAIPTEFAALFASGDESGPRDLPDENVWGFYENSL